MKEIRPRPKTARSATPAPRPTSRVRDVPRFVQQLHTERSEPAAPRKQVEEPRPRLNEAVERYKELYELAPVGFVTLDKSGRILELNQKAARLLALPLAWLIRQPFLVFVAPHDLRRFLGVLARIRQTPEQHTIDVDLLVGEQLLPVEIVIWPSISGDARVHWMTIIDLSETKRIEKEFKETLDNWHALVYNAADLILTVERSSRITFANRAAWGCSPGALIGTRLPDYASEKDRTKVRKCIAQAFQGQPSSCELTGINDEKDRWYNFRFGPARKNVADETITITVTIAEISEHKLAEESLRASREQLREFAARHDEVREEERTRVAREIHDELGQILTILKMDLCWLKDKTGPDKNETGKKIKSMIGQVDHTIERVRKIVSELRPSILDELGLTAAIEWQVSQFQERTGIRGIVKSNAEGLDLRPDIAAALFRVVQEALTNIVRHSNATEVRVSLKGAPRQLRIFVADNGKGITREEIADRKSFGIIGMSERVHRIGGNFNIYSVPGRGTRLEISAPLK
jgi:PAS domain S-box-containing protein